MSVFLGHILRFCVVMLLSAFGTNMAFAVPTSASNITYFQPETTHFAQGANVSFASRAPPIAVANIEITGGVTVMRGGVYALHWQETVAALFGFDADHIAPKSGVFDFGRGRTAGSYDAINPGPLDDNLAGTFSGGRYNEVVLTEDVVLHRAGTSETPLGQFFTQDTPQSVIQTRIDSAVLPQWPGGGTSPIDSAFEVRIPAGTKIYVGEVSSQGGAFVGGTQQIVVPKPWTIEGVQVLGSSPLQ